MKTDHMDAIHDLIRELASELDLHYEDNEFFALKEQVRMSAHLSVQRRALIQTMFSDWDGSSPIASHIQDWQATEDGFRIGLLSEAYGNYRRGAIINIPPRTILRWAKALNIEIPTFDPRQHFLSLLLRDWDRTVPLADHVRDWQDLSNPLKYQLITGVLGNTFRNRPIPLTTIQYWIRLFNIEVPVSRRTATPSRRTLIRWKKNEDRRRTDQGAPPL